MRQGIVVAAAVAVLAAAAGIWLYGSTRSNTNDHIRRVLPAGRIRFATNAAVHIESASTTRSHTVHVTCLPSQIRGFEEAVPGKAYTPAAVCAAIALRPGGYTNEQLFPSCPAGPIDEVHVVGEVAGHRVNIQQRGHCGPESTYTWKALLNRYRTAYDLPGWVRADAGSVRPELKRLPEKDSPPRLTFRPPAEGTFESPLRSLRPVST